MNSTTVMAAPVSSPKAQSQPQVEWGGKPLRSTLMFLLIPGAVMGSALVFGLPAWALYGGGAVAALLLLMRSVRDPEWLLAVAILYVPLSKMAPLDIVAGINGTNLLLMALVACWVVRRSREGKDQRLPGRRLALVFLLLVVLSTLPAIDRFGWAGFMDRPFPKFKAVCEQLLLYFAVAGTIRDGRMARRLVVYAMLSTLLILVLGTQEWLDRGDSGSIDKSRVMGPQLQPNDFGAFLVTSLAPYMGLAMVWFPRIKVALLAPVGLLGLRIMMATFSRGALLALLVAGLVMSLVRGKRFTLTLAALAGAALLLFPQLLNNSATERMEQTNAGSAEEEALDRSSADRLIVWQAALDMTAESPLLGKGFGTFSLLKEQYTARPVTINDPHNMYLYVASQIGVPALLVFCALLFRMYLLGRRVALQGSDEFARAIGIAATGLAAGWAVACLFGSRMTETGTSGTYWIWFAIAAHMARECRAQHTAALQVHV